ncbi:hypothetical protein SAMN02745131_00074 [Flavisolibacter ginsengisoli DSM 18119]|uniref:Uncharacterized protein n=2 Tax=Flavisolibacter TaxID=398041 RepID=A0A1M4SD98_9BACT|nr:hypothetical protein SAMN02745131_00074 [Flavisolibacter ginsengisoli DSM 18119]
MDYANYNTKSLVRSNCESKAVFIDRLNPTSYIYVLSEKNTTLLMTDDLWEQKFLNKILETEKAKRVLLTPKSLIKTTKEVAANTKIKFDLNDKPFRIHRNIQLDLFIWIVMAFLILGPLIYGIVNDLKSNDVNIFGVIVPSSLIILFLFVGYKNLTIKSLTSPIIFTSKDLTINDEVFNWNEIQETFYVYRFPGRWIKALFVIGFTNGLIQYFDLSNQLGFKYNDKDFSNLVEHYKNFVQEVHL